VLPFSCLYVTIHLTAREADMMLREEFIELLRSDSAFREEVRRQVLTDDLLELPRKFDRLSDQVAALSEQVAILVEAVQHLTEAQQRTEATLQRTEAALQRHERLIEQNTEQIRLLIEAQQRTEQAQQRTEAALQRHERLIERNTEQIQLLIAAQQRTEEALQRMEQAQQRTEEAQQRTEQALQQLLNWQRGEAGRRDGERYEREMIRNAPVLLHGGHGGSPEHPWIQQRLTEVLMPLLGEDLIEAEASPYLADLIWWKGDQVAVVEISVQVNGYDILRAARRAETLRRVGFQAVPIVIGDDWAAYDSRLQATTKHVEWKVGSDISEGFINFRRTPAN
jgi:hypothetical protein